MQNKTQKATLGTAIIVLSAIAARFGIILISSLIAYSCSDPQSLIAPAALFGSLVGDLITGMIFSRLLPKDFTTATRIALASVLSLALSMSEMLISSAFLEGTPGYIMLPVSLAVSAIGAAAVSRKTKSKHKRRKIKR